MVPSCRSGRPRSVSTIFRWMTDGLRGSAGELVFLECVRRGTVRMSSREALGRFYEALNAQDTAKRPAAPETTRERKARTQRAESELAHTPNC
jgi:hypothetical protein